MRYAILGSRGYPSTYGGYETLVRNLAPHLVRTGNEVTVYCRFKDNDKSSWIDDGIDCRATWGLDTKSFSTLTFGFTAAGDAVFRRYDAVLVLNIANGFWIPLLRAAKVPTIVNTDGLEWERGKWNKVGRLAFRTGAWLTARTATSLVCDSEAIGAVWRDLFRRDSLYIPYGAAIFDNPGRDRLTTIGLQNEPYLLVVARLAPENNVDLTLDALEILGANAPPRRDCRQR